MRNALSPKRNWEQVRVEWQAWKAAGGADYLFAKDQGIPYSTFNKWIPKWRSRADKFNQDILVGGQISGTGMVGDVRLSAHSSSPLLPSTLLAQQTLEKGALKAAEALVNALQQNNPTGVKAAVEILNRTIRPDEHSKSSPYSDLTDEQLMARIRDLSPQPYVPQAVEQEEVSLNPPSTAHKKNHLTKED